MADAITGASSELDAAKQALVAEVVQRELAAQAKLVPTIMDYSSRAVPGASSIAIPRLTSFTAVDRTEGAAGDATALTAAVDTITLNQNAYVSWIVDSYSALQSNIDEQLEFAKRAASAHARFVDNAIITELETASATTTAGAAITRDIVLEMRETLLAANANPDQLYLAFGPETDSEMLAITQFTEQQIYGSSAVPSGVIPQVYGVKLVMSNLIAADKYFMYDKEGLGIAFQQRAKMSDQGANEYGSGARRFVLDQVFGVSGLQNDALILKDNNV